MAAPGGGDEQQAQEYPGGHEVSQNVVLSMSAAHRAGRRRILDIERTDHGEIRRRVVGAPSAASLQSRNF
jgi:hypothetical protein